MQHDALRPVICEPGGKRLSRTRATDQPRVGALCPSIVVVLVDVRDRGYVHRGVEQVMLRHRRTTRAVVSDPATAAAALLATVSNGEAAWRHQMRHGDVRGGRACTRAQRGGVFGATTKQTSSCVTDNLRVLDGREMTCALHQTE